MAIQDILNDMTPDQQALVKRFFDLTMNRVIKKIHDGLDGKDQKQMEEVFQGGDDKKKEEFTKKYLADFDYLFIKEAKSVGEELAKGVKEE